jgi:hypothetical protein
MPIRPDTLRALLDARLAPLQLDTFVTTHRMAGHSWRNIAATLTDTTGVGVTGETLRQWYRDLDAQQAA